MVDELTDDSKIRGECSGGLNLEKRQVRNHERNSLKGLTKGLYESFSFIDLTVLS
jgi:hypothetical protein